MRLLSLDCSTMVGWSYWASADAIPRCGTWKAPKAWAIENYGQRFKAFHDWLCDMVTTFDPQVLAFEGPVLPRGGMNFNTTEHTLRTLIGLVSVAELVATLRGLRCFEVNVSTAKKRLAGHGRAEKSEMLLMATNLGYPCADDHQADSIGVALVVFDQLGEIISVCG